MTALERLDQHEREARDVERQFKGTEEHIDQVRVLISLGDYRRLLDLAQAAVKYLAVEVGDLAAPDRDDVASMLLYARLKETAERVGSG